MADLVTSTKTSHGCEDVIVGALQFFAAEDWRQTEQSARKVTFLGRPEIPWYLLLLMTLGFAAFVGTRRRSRRGSRQRYLRLRCKARDSI